MQYFIGIDVSTTATKALLIDEQGTLMGIQSAEYSFSSPRPLWSEQDPELWWQGTASSLRKLLEKTSISADQVAAVGLTGQMHGMVLLDKQGVVLRPAILWNDQRTGAECNLIREKLGKAHLIQITGNNALAGFTAPKILWIREHEPGMYQKTRHILLPKDYVRFRLTGRFASDKADASGTLLLDLKNRRWSEEALATLGIPREWLPELFEGPEVTGQVSPEAAAITGLRPGTPVMAGGGDQAAQAVGVGAVAEGIVAITLGTSGVVFASMDHPAYEREGRLHAFCHAVPNRWHMMGVMLSAAGSLTWLRDTLAPHVPFDELLTPAEAVPPGSEGLLFLPYLSGERTPHPDPLARGGFVGLTLRHRLAHLTRAVLEGVAFGLKDSFELMRASGLSQIRQVRVSGGGARSPLWRQIIADVLDTELLTVNTAEGAAFGAALLAGVGVGNWSTVDEACLQVVKQTSHHSPDPQAVARYQQYYQVYRDLYPALKPTFNALANAEGLTA